MERKGSPGPKKVSKLSPTAKPFRSTSRSRNDSSEAPSEPKPLPQRPDAKKKAPKPCRFFQQGNCKRGADCQFLHEAVAVAPVPAPVAVAVAPAPARLLQEVLDSDSSSSNASVISEEGAPTYVCPFCQGSYTEAELGMHFQEHTNENPNQTCPICASQPGGDPNYKSQDVFGHFALRHGGPGRRGRPGKGLGQPVPAPAAAAAGFSFGAAKNKGEEAPPKVMKTCHAIDSTLRGMQSRGADFIWEYAWRVDSGQEVRNLDTPCSACQGQLALSEPRALLPCGCSFHTGCVANDQHIEQCPVCKKAV